MGKEIVSLKYNYFVMIRKGIVIHSKTVHYEHNLVTQFTVTTMLHKSRGQTAHVAKTNTMV